MLRRRDLLYLGQISRPLNLVIALFTFGAAAFLATARTFAFLADWRFWLEGVLIMIIMAGGYWINDVYDFKIDRVNKPHRAVVNAFISPKKVITSYLVLLFTVFTLGWLLPLRFVALNLPAMGLLYLYARYFKRAAVVGNLVIASLTGAVVLAGAGLGLLRLPLVWMMIFAFIITFIREVTKDVEDIKGDILFGLRTLPIQVGIRITKRVLLAAYLVLLFTCYLPIGVYYLRSGGDWKPAYLIASLLLVQAPVVYTLYLMRRAFRPRDFGLQSRWLKGIIAGGLVSVLLL